jgi:3-phosphoshikimate 1-carboxyvinyltransferase
MSLCQVRPSRLSGSITIPPSKSHTLRAVLFASLARGQSVINNALTSPDVTAMIDACRMMGANIEIFPDKLVIEGTSGHVRTPDNIINVGNSGIVLRFITAIAAVGNGYTVVTGDHSIRHQRPMEPLLSAMQQLGAYAVSTRENGFAPVVIKGPIRSGKAHLDGQDSQPVSALLIALALAEGDFEIQVENAGEKPWVAMTLDWFDRLGIECRNDRFEHYSITGGQRYDGFHYHVPGDLSSAAFPIAAAIITGSSLAVHGVDLDDCQGDKELIATLQKMGADIKIDRETKMLSIAAGSRLKGITVDINGFIDAITILAVVACFAEGETKLLNASIARNKECNRIQSIATELKKMGADIEELDDGLLVKGARLTGASMSSYGDHRMAMSLITAALAAEGSSSIGGVQCVSKTYPTFFVDFQTIGGNLVVTR